MPKAKVAIVFCALKYWLRLQLFLCIEILLRFLVTAHINLQVEINSILHILLAINIQNCVLSMQFYAVGTFNMLWTGPYQVIVLTRNL